MVKAKIFSDSNEVALQKTINQWLQAAGPIVIHHALQSESVDESIGWSMTISIFYVEPESQL